MEDAQSLSVQKEETQFSNKTIIQLINIHTKNDNQRDFNNPVSVSKIKGLNTEQINNLDLCIDNLIYSVHIQAQCPFQNLTT